MKLREGCVEGEVKSLQYEVDAKTLPTRPDALKIVPESAPESSKTLPETSKTTPGTPQERTGTHHGAADALQPPTSAKVY